MTVMQKKHVTILGTLPEPGDDELAHKVRMFNVRSVGGGGEKKLQGFCFDLCQCH